MAGEPTPLETDKDLPCPGEGCEGKDTYRLRCGKAEESLTCSIYWCEMGHVIMERVDSMGEKQIKIVGNFSDDDWRRQ